jgi:Flp pilus assembly protein TadG
MVELALSVPLLFVILLGAVEFARVTYVGIQVSNAARAAAQYAATNGGATSDSGGITTAAQNDTNLGSAVTATVTSDTCVCSGDETTTVTCNPSNSSPVCPSGQHLMETVAISTSATYDPIINYGGLMGMAGLKGSYTLHGYAKQMVLPQ